MIRFVTLLVMVGVVLAPLPGASRAGCRHVNVVQQQAVVAYPAVAQPYYWNVAQSLQDRASAKQIAAMVMEELKAQAAPGSAATSPQTMPLVAGDELSLVRAHCAGCHTSNTKAVQHLDLSDLTNLDCDTRLAMVAAIADGSMPKGKKLDGATMGNLIGQLSYAKTAPNAGVKPQAAPKVEQLEAPPVPEPEKPARWKFNPGDIVYGSRFGDDKLVVQLHQKMPDGSRYYRVVIVESGNPVTLPESELAWHPFKNPGAEASNGETGWVPESEVPPIQSVTPSEAPPFLEEINP